MITGEAGKAAEVSAPKSELVALIDSDNVLERKDWLKEIAKPFRDPDIVRSKPLYFTYRKEYSVINRYYVLLGLVDP